MRKRERHLTNAKKEVQAIENRIEEIDVEMNASDGTDYVYLGRLSEEKEGLEEKLLALYEEIEALENLLQQAQ